MFQTEASLDLSITMLNNWWKLNFPKYWTLEIQSYKFQIAYKANNVKFKWIIVFR